MNELNYCIMNQVLFVPLSHVKVSTKCIQYSTFIHRLKVKRDRDGD